MSLHRPLLVVMFAVLHAAPAVAAAPPAAAAIPSPIPVQLLAERGADSDRTFRSAAAAVTAASSGAPLAAAAVLAPGVGAAGAAGSAAAQGAARVAPAAAAALAASGARQRAGRDDSPQTQVAESSINGWAMLLSALGLLGLILTRRGNSG